MAAVKALACLVHCPVKPSGLQPLPFPLSEVLPEGNHSKSTEQAAALKRLEKVVLATAHNAIRLWHPAYSASPASLLSCVSKHIIVVHTCTHH